jgi:hypothetical protein
MIRTRAVRPTLVPSRDRAGRFSRPVRYILTLTVAADGVRLLLLAEHTGTRAVSVRRARSWAATTSIEAVLPAIGTAYHTAGRQAPTAVHLAHTERSPWLPAIRRIVGPLAEITLHATPAPGWPGAAALALTGLGTDPITDPEHVAILAEHAHALTEGA